MNKLASERRLKRREHHQQNILAVAGRLFLKNGYQGTSVDDIASAANVNKASIYYYFRDKASILNCLMSIPMQDLIEEAKLIAESKMLPYQKFKAILKGHVKWQVSHPGIAGIGHVERKNLSPKLRSEYVAMRDRYESIIVEIIEAAIAKGELSFGDAKLAALFTLGIVNSIMQWYNPRGRLSSDEIADEAWVYISRALQVKEIAAKA